jgi:hypothetical protein
VPAVACVDVGSTFTKGFAGTRLAAEPVGSATASGVAAFPGGGRPTLAG